MISKNASKLIAATLASQLIGFILLPLLTRLYSPSQFGVYTVFTSLLNIISVSSTLRFDMAIPIAKCTKLAINTTALGMICVTLTSVVTFVLVMALHTSSNLYTLLPIAILISGFQFCFTYWYIRNGEFSKIAFSKIGQTIVMLIAQLSLARIFNHGYGLIVGQILGYSASILILCYQSKLIKKIINNTSLLALKRSIKCFIKFPIFSLSATLLNTLAIHLVAVFIAFFYNLETAGYYALTVLAIRVPLSLIGRAVGQVYTHKFIQLPAQKSQEKTQLYIKTVGKMFILGLVIILLLQLFANPIFLKLFGPNWLPATKFSNILAWMYLIEFSVVGPSQNLSLLQRQDLSLIWNIILAICVALSFAPAWLVNASILNTLTYLAISISFCYCLLFAINLHTLKKNDNRRREVLCAE